MHKKIVFAGLAMIGLVSPAQAVENISKAWYEKLSVSGYLDAYYQINGNGLSGGPSGNINAAGSTRTFDIRQNEFSFSGAKISLASTDSVSHVSGQLDLLVGPTALIAAGGPVEQAWVSVPCGPVNLKFGKMVTHLGFEVIETPTNWNYSRSLLFNQVPFYHVGIMASATPLEGLGLMLGAANGNSIEQANDEAKDVLAQINFSRIKNISLVGNYYLESNRAATPAQPFENTHYLELTGNFQVLEPLSLGLDYLYKTTLAATDKDSDNTPLGSAQSPKAQGYALYANWLLPLTGLSLIGRFEQWYAPDAGYLVDDYTLTLKYLSGAFTHTLELRSDVSTSGAFEPQSGLALAPDELKKQQLTLTYGATFTF